MKNFYFVDLTKRLNGWVFFYTLYSVVIIIKECLILLKLGPPKIPQCVILVKNSFKEHYLVDIYFDSDFFGQI